MGRRGVRVSRETWLRARPVRAVEDYEVGDDGSATILVEIKPRGLLSRILSAVSIVPPPRYKRIVLDPMGTRVWLLCDGRHTVEDIIRRLVRETGLSRRSMEIAVYKYITMLVEKGLVVLVLPEGSGEGEKG